MNSWWADRRRLTWLGGWTTCRQAVRTDCKLRAASQPNIANLLIANRMDVLVSLASTYRAVVQGKGCKYLRKSRNFGRVMCTLCPLCSLGIQYACPTHPWRHQELKMCAYWRKSHRKRRVSTELINDLHWAVIPGQISETKQSTKPMTSISFYLTMLCKENGFLFTRTNVTRGILAARSTCGVRRQTNSFIMEQKAGKNVIRKGRPVTVTLLSKS